MSNSETLNLSSLKMVQDELVATIEQSAIRLEQFAGDRNNGELLQNCIDGIKQIRGTLSLIQLKGVDMLASELVEHITDITLGEEEKTNRKLELLTSAFFILPRYLEYCTQTSRSMAMLLIPYINELRQARRVPVMPESYFYAYEVPTAVRRPDTRMATGSQEDLSVLVRRLRHMYQVGLLKVLQGTQIKPSLGMMGRALERLDATCSPAALGNLWWVAGAALVAISEKGLLLTKGRKMLLSNLDREIKRLQFEGNSGLTREPDRALIKEFLYLIALSRCTEEQVRAVANAYAVKPIAYTDAELAREMEFLKGPSANTMNSMAAVLSDELRSTKNILERAAQGGAELLTETPELVDTLRKVADILSVVGLIDHV